MPLFSHQSAASQTQYANLAQAARQHELQRSMADLPGGIVRKTIKGRDYVYFQFKLPDGTPQQIYIGLDDEATRQVLAERDNPLAKQARQHLQALCESAMALGAYGVIPKHARVLARLADHGLFRAGGVLVGTHAYLAYQNRFGIRWSGGETTVDLDFAHPGRNISIALNTDLEIDAHEAIQSLRMGFLPVSHGTRYVKADEPDFDLDFLTCLHRGKDKPLHMPKMNVTLQPLRFMEFSMQDPVVAVLVSSRGPILTNVPRPERYAVAKILLHGERLDGHQPEKAGKDLLQAASLVDYLSRHEPEALQGAWSDLLARGRAWQTRARQGFDALKARYPDIENALAWRAGAKARA